MFIRQALTRLALTHPPSTVRFLLIDLKGGVVLAPFDRLPHALGEVIDNATAALAALDEMRSELDRRLGELRRAGLADIAAWHDAGLPRWPRLVVVVDEVAELTIGNVGKDKAAQSERNAATGRLCELGRLGRAAGIHLVVCTQRPDAEAVPGQLKANLGGTVAFRVRNSANSHILLDSDRAALLPPRKGRAVWQHERMEEVQVVHLSQEECQRLLEERWLREVEASRTPAASGGGAPAPRAGWPRPGGRRRHSRRSAGGSDASRHGSGGQGAGPLWRIRVAAPPASTRCRRARRPTENVRPPSPPRCPQRTATDRRRPMPGSTSTSSSWRTASTRTWRVGRPT